MWLFPWNANSDFFSQYEIGEHVKSFDGLSIWTLFKAKKKSTKDPVSIFRFDFKEPNRPAVEQARNALKKLKTLKHPSILKYVDSSESEKSICVVTEPVVPLEDYLEEASVNFKPSQKEFSMAYGLLNVSKGLNFINNDCQLKHNNINIFSIFVNNSGVWKIGGLEYVCPIDEEPLYRNNYLSEKYIPPEKLDPSKAKHPGTKAIVDSWGLGCLVWESFNKPITSNSSVKTVGKMPKPLSVHYNKLVQSSPRHRISPMDFVKECQQANIFFNNPLLETITSLEEIHLVKDNDEKTKFFQRLEGELEFYPEDICKNKIFPDLMNAFEFGEAGSAILNPLFKIGKFLSDSEYQNKLVPCIIKLYACKDRAIRCKLLQQLDSYISYLSSNIINDQIFPQVVQGFLDSNFTIREQTVKSMLHIVPKLSATNLNDELMKHLTRLQARDDEGGIRANTTVCLGKIAKHLNSQTQQTILMGAFLRGLRDPFSHVRNASIAAITANEQLFSNKDCAAKILPALCQMFIDPEINVRRLSFKSVRLFVDRLESQSESDASDASLPKNNTETVRKGSVDD